MAKSFRLQLKYQHRYGFNVSGKFLFWYVFDSIIMSFIIKSIITISKFIISDEYYIHYNLCTMNNEVIRY